MLAAQASEIGLKKMRFELRSQYSPLGGKVKPGLFGKYFSLTDLDGGDLNFNTDFRSVYMSVLEQCLHTHIAAVPGRKFPPFALV